MHPHFALLDQAILFAYFAGLIGIGLVTLRQRKNGESPSEDYLVAGRTLSLPAFVATLVATWYGGILGVGEFTFTTGIATWTVFGLPYYVFAVVYAFFLAGKIRSSANLTIPDTIEAAHGRVPALISAALVFLLVTPAPYVLMLGTLLQSIFGSSLLTAITLGTVISVGFVIIGGFWNDVRTNLFQFLLMFAAFALLVGFAVGRHGGWDFLAARLPETLRTPTGGLPLVTIIVWYFIALWTLIDPGFHQRCAAARDTTTARRGILLSVACWAIFDFLTVTAGLYARALLPNLATPIHAYPALAEVILPPGAKGLFWVGMLATIMSTVLSYTFLASITLGRDIVWRLSPVRAAGRDIFWTRVGVVLTALLSIGVALSLPSVVSLWYTIGTTFVPGLLLPLIAAYSPRLRIAGGFVAAAMLLGTLLPIGWMVIGARRGGLDTAHYPLGIEPMYVGLAMSLLIWAAGTARRTLASKS